MQATALDRAITQLKQNEVVHSALATDRARRYIWYVGEDIPHPEVPGGWIERGRVTPVLALPMWERIMDVPLELRLDYRGLLPNGEWEEAKYEVPPGGIFSSIQEQYGHWGVQELRPLYDRPVEEVAGMNINGIFCPWMKSRDMGVDEIPKPYRLIKEHIHKVAENLKNDSRRDILTKIAEDMLLSIRRSEAFDTALVDEAEGQKELRYTKHTLRCLDRLERRRKDHAINDMAAVQNEVYSKIPEILAQPNTNPELAGIFQQMTEQNALLREELAMQREAMMALLAERKAPAPKQEEPEAPAPPKIPVIKRT